ncbi:site-specific integrase [Bifidobacterium sp. ESL0775]|uniref:tyrosine-type recombinase/integrase n=1 Tax=Bifidobacterium sp. ESL0775 TaxID=2983230 RepID=UPI0023F9F509|nr:site-specific integrase [Bifidobacterium sp. ESL0775]WEV69929.1 site-specific integrase [Bifidobacterium sp. ESL0775]
MAKAWVTDRWLSKDAPASVRRSLNAAKRPERARVPQEWRLSSYGKGRRWRVDWYAVNPSTGLNTRHNRKFESRGDAESYAAAMEDDLRSGRYIDPADRSKTFASVATEWFKSKNAVKATTRDRLGRELRIYCLPKWGAIPIRAISEASINEWVAQLLDGSAPANLKSGGDPSPLSPGTIKHVVGVTFGSVLRYAAKPSRKWIAFNPLEDVRLPKDTKPEKRAYLTDSEVELLAESAEGVGQPQDGLIVLTLAYTGLRINELFALQVQDVDLKARRLKVSKTWTRDGGRQILGTPKSGITRKVPIPAFLVPRIKEQIDGRPFDSWLFPNSQGGHIADPNWRDRVWRKAVAGSGLDVPNLVIHSLRHTYASLSIAAGASVKTLQSAMGHADATETLNIYADLWPEQLDNVADALDLRRREALKSRERQ